MNRRLAVCSKVTGRADSLQFQRFGCNFQQLSVHIGTRFLVQFGVANIYKTTRIFTKRKQNRKRNIRLQIKVTY